MAVQSVTSDWVDSQVAITEEAPVISSVISAFHEGAEILRHIAATQSTLQGDIPAQREPLQTSLETGEWQVQHRENAYRQELGDRFAVDGIARARLSSITAMLEADLIRVLRLCDQHDDFAADFAVLYDNSVILRSETVMALDELRMRIVHEPKPLKLVTEKKSMEQLSSRPTTGTPWKDDMSSSALADLIMATREVDLEIDSAYDFRALGITQEDPVVITESPNQLHVPFETLAYFAEHPQPPKTEQCRRESATIDMDSFRLGYAIPEEKSVDAPRPPPIPPKSHRRQQSSISSKANTAPLRLSCSASTTPSRHNSASTATSYSMHSAGFLSPSCADSRALSVSSGSVYSGPVTESRAVSIQSLELGYPPAAFSSASSSSTNSRRGSLFPKINTTSKGPTEMTILTGRPCKANNFWGLCKGSWNTQEKIKSGLKLQSRPEGMYTTVSFWRCRHCAFEGELSRNGEIDPRVYRHAPTGITYRWLFLAKCHVKRTSSSSSSKTTYGCIFCADEGRSPGTFANEDSLFNHIAGEHCGPMSHTLQRKTQCISGRVASNKEEFDINIPSM